jgi:prepilin-type N-terminal cleavage/methylation domain-containing protein
MPMVFHRRKDWQTESAGFTLVELVVVIAIASVLAALMLPSLSSAKEKSRRAVCKGNIRQLLQTLDLYADDNSQFLPSSKDNIGNYHSIRLSDAMFTNLVDLAGGNSNIFYCPNIVFGGGPVAQHDKYGYVIGYSYLAANIQGTIKGADTWDGPTKWTDPPSTPLIADANYWTLASSSLPALLKVAPHTDMGAATTAGSSFTVGLSGISSASIGAVGGNVGYLNSSVVWRSMGQMQTYAASSQSDGYGNW